MRYLIFSTLLALSFCDIAYSIHPTTEISAGMDIGIGNDIHVEFTKLEIQDMYLITITLPTTDGEKWLGAVHLLTVRQVEQKSRASSELCVPLRESRVPGEYYSATRRSKVTKAKAEPYTVSFRVSPAMLKRTFICADYFYSPIGGIQYKIDLESFREEQLIGNKHNNKAIE